MKLGTLIGYFFFFCGMASLVTGMLLFTFDVATFSHDVWVMWLLIGLTVFNLLMSGFMHGLMVNLSRPVRVPVDWDKIASEARKKNQ